jgi:hypothetical protein
MNDHDQLTNALRDHADRVGNEHPLGLEDVKGRARGIRRRRWATSGLAAAAVLAVAVPAGIVVSDRTSGGTDSGPAASPSVDVTPLPSPSDDPTKGVLTTDAPIAGDPAGISYLLDGRIHEPGGGTVDLDEAFDIFTPFFGGWVAAGWADGKLALLDPEGVELHTRRTTGSMAVSPDGTIVGYVTPDGRIMTIGDDGNEVEMSRADDGGRVELVGFIGSSTCQEGDPEGGGCTVFYNVEDPETGEQRGHYVTSHGIGSPLADFLAITGVSVDGRVAGVTSVADAGSCGALLSRDWGKAEWDTCDYSLGRFSPDGKYLIGLPAYLDGIGSGSIAILDATTGDVVAEWKNTGEDFAFINNAVWDTDGTLLATVWEKDSWSLMRMAPDGSLATVLADLGGNMDEVPLQFPVAP